MGTNHTGHRARLLARPTAGIMAGQGFDIRVGELGSGTISVPWQGLAAGMNMRRTMRVSRVGRITKALTGYYPRQLQALITHYSRVSGITPGHLDYERFIILCTGRTGSSFLQSLLNSHSQVVAFGEIFQSFDAIRWDYGSYRREAPRRQLSACQDDPIGFLETHVFAKFPKEVAAVGFRLFYTHAQHPRQRCLWPYLRDYKEFKIIHLKRRNVLRAYLSHKTAKASGRWRDLAGESGDDRISIYLDHDDCLRKFTETRNQEEKHDVLFASHDKIDLFYEELSRDYRGEMRRVQQFLGVDYQEVVPATYKQARQPLSAAISNYHELKEGFKGTPWEGFFED
jgi:LPS sulfotransferase NodH